MAVWGKRVDMVVHEVQPYNAEPPTVKITRDRSKQQSVEGRGPDCMPILVTHPPDQTKYRGPRFFVGPNQW